MKVSKKSGGTFAIMIIFSMLIIYFGASILLFDTQTENSIKKLFAESGSISDRKFTYNQIDNLPLPVQRYFKNTLEDGQHYVSYAKLKHTGDFRQSEKQGWMPIEGQEYFTTEQPGFIWIGKIKPFPLIWITGLDQYVKGKGNFQIKLMSVFTVADAPNGRELDEGELMRWLGEAPLFPTALLPSTYLRWEEIDSNSAKAIIEHSGLAVNVIFHFNEKGEVVQMVGDRYRFVNNSYLKEKWTGYYGNHTKIQNMKVPSSIEVAWDTESGNFSYARFKINEIQYNNPSRY